MRRLTAIIFSFFTVMIILTGCDPRHPFDDLDVKDIDTFRVGETVDIELDYPTERILDKVDKFIMPRL